MTSEKKYELIERFLAEQMTKQEKQDFEKQLQADASLQEELDLHRQISTTLKGERVHQFRDVLTKVDKSWEAPSSSKEAVVKSFNLKKIIGIAATVLVLVIAYQYFFTHKNLGSEQLFADNFQSYKMVLNQRSSTDDNSIDTKLFNQAISAYEAQKYEEAASSFQKLQEQKPELIAFQFYHALSALSLNQSDLAITLLKDISAKTDHLFVEQSRWYLALAYLQNKDLEKAKAQLETISKGTYQYDEAQKILNLL